MSRKKDKNCEKVSKKNKHKHKKHKSKSSSSKSCSVSVHSSSSSCSKKEKQKECPKTKRNQECCVPCAPVYEFPKHCKSKYHVDDVRYVNALPLVNGGVLPFGNDCYDSICEVLPDALNVIVPDVPGLTVPGAVILPITPYVVRILSPQNASVTVYTGPRIVIGSQSNAPILPLGNSFVIPANTLVHVVPTCNDTLCVITL